MRFGLVGTGPWAELAHAPGLAAAEGVELVGIWGRSLGRAQALADSYGVAAYDDYAALLADVDAVAFAVPPAVQARARPGGGRGRPPPAPRQAGRGRSRRGPGAARGRHRGRRGVGGLLHRPVRRRDPGLDRGRPRDARAGTAGGCAGSARCRSPTTRSAPHRGGTRRVGSGTPGRTRCPRSSPRSARSRRSRRSGAGGDEVCLVASHASGATSTIALTQFAPPAASQYEATVWGEAGFSTMPPATGGRVRGPAGHGRRGAGGVRLERAAARARPALRGRGRRAARAGAAAARRHRVAGRVAPMTAPRVLFLGGTGIISSACSRRAVEQGLDLRSC